jgi:hypothetical protein
MKTLTIAAACLAGGVALGATSGVVAADLITGKDIENGSVTGKDIKKGSVPLNRLSVVGSGGDAGSLPMESISLNFAAATVTGLTAEWQEGPLLYTIPEDRVASRLISVHWHGDLSAENGACQVQLRIGDKVGGMIVGTNSAVQSPRDAASGQATGKRQHEPIRVRLFYRGNADSCTMGSPLNPSQIMLENVQITSY